METVLPAVPAESRPRIPTIDWEQELTSGFSIRYIRLKARQLVITGRISPADRQDVEQDLAVVLLERASRFDPSKAHWNAFVATILERQVATLLETRRTLKRKPPTPVVSLSIRVKQEGGESQDLGQLIESCHLTPLTGHVERDRLATTDLQLDMAKLVSCLPENLARLAQQLQVEPLAKIARQTGVSRTKLYEGVNRLRYFFAGRGFAEFCDVGRSVRS